MRAKVILMAADGQSNDQIAACPDTRREVVSQWRKRFFEQRLPGLEELPRPGRPRGFFPGLIARVKAWACELPTTLGAPLSRWSIRMEERLCSMEECVTSNDYELRRELRKLES